jgi:hypothetical protein
MAWHGFITTPHHLYIVYDAIHRMALIPISPLSSSHQQSLSFLTIGGILISA